MESGPRWVEVSFPLFLNPDGDIGYGVGYPGNKPAAVLSMHNFLLLLLLLLLRLLFMINRRSPLASFAFLSRVTKTVTVLSALAHGIYMPVCLHDTHVSINSTLITGYTQFDRSSAHPYACVCSRLDRAAWHPFWSASGPIQRVDKT